MNEIQKKYIQAKAAYEAAVRSHEWELADKLSDEFLDAEAKLVKWAFEKIDETGMMSDVELSTMWKNWTNPKYTDRILDLCVRLKA